MKTKKITYAAACAAVGAVAVLIASYTPAKVVPLIFYSAALYISLRYVGWWGLISAIVALTLSFFTAGGFTGSFALALTVFTPYAFFAFAVRKLTYGNVKHAILRGSLAIADFLIEALVLLLLMRYLGEVNFVAVLNNVGSWALFLVLGLAAVPTDFFFRYATDTALYALNKRTGGKTKDDDNNQGDAADDDDDNDENNGDVFK